MRPILEGKRVATNVLLQQEFKVPLSRSTNPMRTLEAATKFVLSPYSSRGALEGLSHNQAFSEAVSKLVFAEGTVEDPTGRRVSTKPCI